MQWTTVPLFLLGLGLLVDPRRRGAFVASMLLLAADCWLRAPINSNHTMLLNFLVLTVLATGAWHLLRGSSWQRFFADVRPPGRMLLLIMYTFGIFHKINSDFLNPLSSCAVALWRMMPPPLSWIDTAPMHYLAIYGTFAVEGLVMVLLIVPRWRHWGICIGVAFHSLLALSGWAMYPIFTTLAIVLHTLFLDAQTALQITRSTAWQRLNTVLRRPMGLSLVLLGLAPVILLARHGQFGLIGALWLVFMVTPLMILAREGYRAGPPPRTSPGLWSRVTVLNLIPLLFFLNCFSPYLGVKNAQSMNMFANLRLEGGGTNHLVFPDLLLPDSYLADVIQITGAEGSAWLSAMAQDGAPGLVYYEFLVELQRRAPEAQVAYIRQGQQVPLTPVPEILKRDGDMLHAPWIRKVLHFLPVRSDSPLGC